MLKTRFALTLLLLGLSCVSVLAQEACPDLVQSALEYIDATCTGIERNQACYGNLQIEAVPQPDVTDFKFDAPGDIENITDIQSLNLSGMSTPDEWGVSLLSVQANLPDSSPGQNVTLLLFGDVTIENKGGATQVTLLEVTASSNVRVRSGAGTQNGQIGSLAGGDVVQADGRNEAGDWLRVQLADGTAGWVAADLVTINGDSATLAVVEGTEIAGTTYGPMQAFYFTSGIGNPECTEAPPDGMLIQTPAGAGTIDLLINEVQVNVGSTLYLYAQPSAILHVAVLEGQATLTTGGVTLTVPAGAVGIVPLDENALPNGTPGLQGYTDNQAASLESVVSVLPEDIEIAPGLTEAELNTPLVGNWVLTTTDISISGDGCTSNKVIGETASVGIMSIGREGLQTASRTYALSGENTYSLEYDASDVWFDETGAALLSHETVVWTLTNARTGSVTRNSVTLEGLSCQESVTYSLTYQDE